MKYYLAVDLGATSGRHIVGYYDEQGQIQLEEVHRFKTGMDESKDDLVWDLDRIFNEIVTGIKNAVKKYPDIEAIGIDSWGVDYVLLNNDQIIKPYYAYRNKRVETSIPKVHEIIPFEELYRLTGIQFASFNTIYQLYEDKMSGRLANATDFLMIPEYFSYLLTGVKAKEYTNASTTGLLNPETKVFSKEIINRLGLPEHLFKDLKQPGYCLGGLKEDIKKEVGKDINVYLVASHDTASAFEAVDCPKDACLISSGTWSLFGIKSNKPVVSETSYKQNFTNEGGVGYIRLLKNIMGMWIVNEICREKGLNIVELVKDIKGCSYKEVVDVNDETLYAPKSMVNAYLSLIKGPKPQTDIELLSSVLYSLAYSYKVACDGMEKITGDKYNYIYIIGGGAKNTTLNEIVENVTGRKVVALPIEATSIGNIKVLNEACK